MAEGTAAGAAGARLVVVVGPRGAAREHNLAAYTGPFPAGHPGRDGDVQSWEHQGRRVVGLRVARQLARDGAARVAFSARLLQVLGEQADAGGPLLVAIDDLRAARDALSPQGLQWLLSAAYTASADLVVALDSPDDVLLLLCGWAFLPAYVVRHSRSGATHSGLVASPWEELYRPVPALGPRPHSPAFGGPDTGMSAAVAGTPVLSSRRPPGGELLDYSRRAAARRGDGSPALPGNGAPDLPSPDTAPLAGFNGAAGPRGRAPSWSVGAPAQSGYRDGAGFHEEAASRDDAEMEHGWFEHGEPEPAAAADAYGAAEPPKRTAAPRAEAAPVPTRPASPQQARYVNIMVEPAAGPGEQASAPGLPGTLYVGLGPHDVRSIVGDAYEHPFPVDELPPVTQGWWLTATARGRAVRGGEVALPLFLPRTGAGWSCPCLPGSLHDCDASQRRAWLAFPVLLPAHRQDADVEVCVYLGRILIQALRVCLPVGGLPATAAIAWSRGSALDDLHAAARRGASLYESGERGRHRVLLGEADGRYITFELGEAQAAQAARILRSVLQDAHLQRRERLGFGRAQDWTSLYDRDLRKDDDAYTADLRALAVAGAEAYRAILGRREHRDRLRAWLDAETRRLGRAPTIQLARAANTRVALPWQLLYHEPLAGDPAALPVCPSALEFGPHRIPGIEIPPYCPYAETHALYPGTVCPYGFWGLAYVLEIPPFAGSDPLPQVTGRRPPADLVMAVNHTLKPDTRTAHQNTLASISGNDRFALATDTEHARTLLVARR